MAAKKKETQSTEKTSPVNKRRFITLSELKVIFERLRKGYNEVTWNLDTGDKIASVWALEYLGKIKTRCNSLYKDDYRIMGSERDAIVRCIYEVAQIVFKENEPRIDSYFEFYSSATENEQRLIRRLIDAEWPFDHIMDHIEKIRKGLFGQTVEEILAEQDEVKEEATKELEKPFYDIPKVEQIPVKKDEPVDPFDPFFDSITVDEQRLISRLMKNKWPFSRIKEYINKIRSGEISRMPAFEILDEEDKEEISCNPDIDPNPFSYHRWDASDGTVYYINRKTGHTISESIYKSLVDKKSKVYFGESPVKKDMVNHPPHYNVGGFEVIDIIRAFTYGLEGIAAVDTGNAIKYILRWHHKNGVEDLKKAKWYIEHLIKEIEDDSN